MQPAVSVPRTKRTGFFSNPVSDLQCSTKNNLRRHSNYSLSGIHPEDTNPHILRIEAGGKIIAFSGDSEWTDDLFFASKGADLFICEASFYAATKKNHMSVKQLLEKVDQVEARKIVLTHAGEKVLEHSDDIPLAIVEGGQVLMDN